jgi:hypothetical protein
MKLIQLLYAIEALAREAEMSHQQRHALRLDKALPIINEIGQYIQQKREKATPKSPIRQVFENCANRWISLQNYLTNGMLEIDSNLVENSIRPLALGRKNYLFAGSHSLPRSIGDAAKDIAMFYSFFATCKQHRRAKMAKLRDPKHQEHQNFKNQRSATAIYRQKPNPVSCTCWGRYNRW